MPPRLLVFALRTLQAWDRWRLRRLARRHPGLDLHPTASTNFAVARFDLAPGARLRIGPGVATERLPGRLHFRIGPGAEVVIGEGAWLSCDTEPVHVAAFDGARLVLGARSWLNGCHVSAKSRVEVGEGAWVGLGSRIFDSDQHPLDADRPEQTQPVTIGPYCWIAADVTVLRGVEIGAHSVVGTRSVVGRSLEPHTLAYGIPAAPRGTVGDRSAIEGI